MSCVKFLADNWITRDETIIYASNEDLFFPKENIKDHRKSKVFRTQVGTNTLQMTFDFLTTEEVNAVLVEASFLGHGFSGSMVIKGNPVNGSWGSPAFQTNLIPSDDFSNGMVFFPTETYRFWRVEINSPSSDYIELGKIFIGKETVIETNNIKFGWSWSIRDNTTVKKNRYGERFIDTKNLLKGIDAGFTLLNVQELKILMDMFLMLRTSKPLWFVADSEELFSDDKHRFCLYGFLERIPSATNVSPSLYDLNFSIDE